MFWVKPFLSIEYELGVENIQYRPCLVVQCGESYPLYSTAEAVVLKSRPIPMPTGIGYSLQRGRVGSLDYMWGVQRHSGPLISLALVRKDLARTKIRNDHRCWELNPDLSITSLNP